MPPPIREALRATDPPPGFADRVLARALAGELPAATLEQQPSAHTPAAQAGPRTPLAWPAHAQRQWFAVAALLLICLLIGGGLYRQQVKQRQRAAAEQQYALALQITRDTLAETRAEAGADTRRELEEAGVVLVEPHVNSGRR